MTEDRSVLAPTHALTVRQPWADAILCGEKDVENRSWPLPPRWVGQWLALHAAMRPDPSASIAQRPAARLGAIVGAVRFGASVRDHDSPWYDGSPWAWPVLEAIRHDVPRPARGALGIWRIT